MKKLKYIKLFEQFEIDVQDDVQTQVQDEIQNDVEKSESEMIGGYVDDEGVAHITNWKKY